MNKRNSVCLLCLFLCGSVFAQSDSARTIQLDSALYPVKTPPRPVDVPTYIPVSDTVKETKMYKRHESVYELKPAVDIPIVAAGTGWSLYAFTRIYKKGASTEEQILSLKKTDVNAFDRSAIRPYKKSLDDVSYYPFYAVMPLPFIFFLTGEKMRDDFWELSFLYWETFAVQGILGTGSTYLVDRYRPYVYDPGTPLDIRESQNAKNSFFAGHVEVVATSTFFISKVYSDYYPDSKIKWLFYGAATVATASMGYLRYEAGEHFPSDIILGSVTGAATGILVPYFHKHKLVKNHDTSLVPVYNDEMKGLALIYR